MSIFQARPDHWATSVKSVVGVPYFFTHLQKVKTSPFRINSGTGLMVPFKIWLDPDTKELLGFFSFDWCVITSEFGISYFFVRKFVTFYFFFLFNHTFSFFENLGILSTFAWMLLSNWDSRLAHAKNLWQRCIVHEHREMFFSIVFACDCQICIFVINSTRPILLPYGTPALFFLKLDVIYEYNTYNRLWFFQGNKPYTTVCAAFPEVQLPTMIQEFLQIPNN